VKTTDVVGVVSVCLISSPYLQEQEQGRRKERVLI